MHKGMVFLFNIVATGCHFKDPIALRHNFSIALPIKLSSLIFYPTIYVNLLKIKTNTNSVFALKSVIFQ